MGITSVALMYVVITVAVLLPLGPALAAVRRRPAAVDSRQGALAQGLRTWLAVMLCQVVALAAAFLVVNRQYGFYNSWADVAGIAGHAHTYAAQTTSGPAPIVRVPISADNPHPRGQMLSVDLPGATGYYAQTQVYLPAAYFEPSQRRTTFPVMVMVSAQRDRGAGIVSLIDPVTLNSNAINSGAASPFIAVYVGGQVAEGIDSECLDVPGAAQETYLTHRVQSGMRERFRVSHNPRYWFISGWSTGGLCASLMVLKHPDVYWAGAGIGPYFHPIFDDPQVAISNPHLVRENDGVEMVRSGKVTQARLLSVMSMGDRESWGPVVDKPQTDGQRPADGRAFAAAAKNLKGAEFIIIDSGGHHPGVYWPYLPQALAWLGRQGL